MKKKLLSLCFFSIYTILADKAILTPKNLTESSISPLAAQLPNNTELPTDVNTEFSEKLNNNRHALPGDNIPAYGKSNRRKRLINNNILENNRALMQDKIISKEKLNRGLPQANANTCPPIVCAPACISPCARPRRVRCCKPKCIVPRVICCPKAKPTICREPLPFCCQPPRVRCCKIRKICFPRPLRCCPQPIKCIPKAGICPIAKPRCPNGLPTPCATCYNPIQYSCSADSGSLIAPGPGMIPQRRNRDAAYARPIELYRETLQDIRQEQEMEDSGVSNDMTGTQGDLINRDLTNQQDLGTIKEVPQQLA